MRFMLPLLLLLLHTNFRSKALLCSRCYRHSSSSRSCLSSCRRCCCCDDAVTALPQDLLSSLLLSLSLSLTHSRRSSFFTVFRTDCLFDKLSRHLFSSFAARSLMMEGEGARDAMNTSER